MLGRVTRANTLGKQADSKKPTSTKELVKKVGPPVKGTPREPVTMVLPTTSPANYVKNNRAEVVIPVKKKVIEKAKIVSRDDFDRDIPGVILDKEADEDFSQQLDELRGTPIPESNKPVQRPFDMVRPHDVQPIPRNQPRPEPQSDTSLNKISLADDSGPKYNIRSGFHLPGVEEIVANKLFNAAVTLTSEELLAMSPSLRKIMARKARNVRVSPTKPAKVYVSTMLDDGTEVPEVPVIPKYTSYILMENISLPDDEIFEVLEYDHNGMKAGSVVQRDPVEAFRADLPEGDERHNLVVVAGRSSSLRCIRAKINNQEGITEAILDSGCQIVAIDQQTAVDLSIVWDPTVTIRMQDVHGGTEETAGLARNVPFMIGEITIYLQLHVQKSAPFEVLIGRPFDVLTESVIKNHANGNQEVTITDPNTGNKCTMGTYVRTNRKRLRFDGADSQSRLIPERAEHETRVKEEGNFSASMI